MSRNVYACQCSFKLGIAGIKSPGKTVFVFKSNLEREEFLSDKNESEYYVVTQKEAFKMTDLNKVNAIPCVSAHPYFPTLNVLKNIRSCWGTSYKTLKEF